MQEGAKKCESFKLNILYIKLIENMVADKNTNK
jgi:hypothetical protein